MIPNSADNVWVSRLRTSDFAATMGFDPLHGREIAHVRGLPVEASVPGGAVVVREWPNLAGRLEPPTNGDIVRWSRDLACEPPTGLVVARADPADPALLSEMTRWMVRLARSLTQIPGVTIAAPPDSPRVIMLTPRGVTARTDLPVGVEAIPRRLGEFPGGVALTMVAQTFDRRVEYADAVRTIIEEG